ncbi:hypothetical protein Drorol1_Dr00001644, partial [Drosera rotundifolia]
MSTNPSAATAHSNAHRVQQEPAFPVGGFFTGDPPSLTAPSFPITEPDFAEFPAPVDAPAVAAGVWAVAAGDWAAALKLRREGLNVMMEGSVSVPERSSGGRTREAWRRCRDIFWSRGFWKGKEGKGQWRERERAESVKVLER